jgi:SAM-dependent methyltransferase
LTITDRTSDLRNLDLIRRDLARYGIDELTPVRWTQRRPASKPSTSCSCVNAPSISAGATSLLDGLRRRHGTNWRRHVVPHHAADVHTRWRSALQPDRWRLMARPQENRPPTEEGRYRTIVQRYPIECFNRLRLTERGKMRRAIKEFVPKSAVDLFYNLTFAPFRFPLRHKYYSSVDNKYGIEIGGPSLLFKTVLPLYQYVRRLDGVNFSTDTIWEGSIKAGDNFNYYYKKSGRQFIADATDLSEIATARYDFLLSSNCLEHVANPIKALGEWKRVIKAGGGLVLVLPKKESNFDHRRPVTKFEHLMDDFTRDVGENDLTHLDEILELHDLRKDPPAGDLEHFRKRSLKNFQNRALHHHVFDVPLIEEMLDHLGFEILDITTTRTDFFALARKS